MNKGLKINEITHYSPKETLELCHQGACIVDVREEYMNGHKQFAVEKTIFCPLSKIEEVYSSFPVDLLLIFADSTGLRSKEAVEFCISRGVKNVANLAGGLVEWERQGLPLAINVKERLSGSCMCQIKYRDV